MFFFLGLSSVRNFIETSRKIFEDATSRRADGDTRFLYRVVTPCCFVLIITLLLVISINLKEIHMKSLAEYTACGT
jgi:hypothetical protein